MKKYLIGAVVLTLAVLATSASAATGSTLTCQTGLPCAGGPTRAWNYTLGGYDMVPQCFPWVFRTDFLNGNLISLYENQRICRQNRAIDFKF